MVGSADLGVPGSPKISGVSGELTTPSPLCSSDKQPLHNRQSVEESCALQLHPFVSCTQSSDIPVYTKPVSLPMVTMVDGPTYSANKPPKLGYASHQPVSGVGLERGSGHQSNSLNTRNKNKNKRKKKGR